MTKSLWCLGVMREGLNACPMLACNAEESDTRVWLHVVHSAGHKKLLFSPDTDVYNIGLTAISSSECDVALHVTVASPMLSCPHVSRPSPMVIAATWQRSRSCALVRHSA